MTRCERCARRRCSRRKFQPTSISSTASSALLPRQGAPAAWALSPLNMYSMLTSPLVLRAGPQETPRLAATCMKCGACVDVCPRQAVVWHIKGTEVAWKPERARLLFLYGAWAMAVMFGGSIIAQGISTILHYFA